MVSADRIARLSKAVKVRARSLAAPGVPADDLEQVMWETIIREGDRYADNDRALVTTAFYRALTERRRLFRVVPGLSQAQDDRMTFHVIGSDNLDPSGDGEVEYLFTPVADDDTSEEGIRLAFQPVAETEVRSVVSSLNDTQRKVAEGLMAGLRPFEIAHELGVSRPLVQYHMGALRKRLAFCA